MNLLMVHHSEYRNKGGIDMAKNNVKINIYGGNVQVLPDVKSVEQHIYTKDSEIIVTNEYK